MTTQGIQNDIAEAIRATWSDAALQADEITLEEPKGHAMGDLTTTVAFRLAKAVGERPDLIAQQIVERLSQSDYATVATGPYINITFAEDVYAARVWARAQGAPTLALYADEEILVEHSSPNLFKPFHIGHLVNNTVGESVVRLMRLSGGHVTTMSYPSDVSLGIAKAVWGMQEKFPEVLDDDALSLTEKMRAAGAAYAYGVERYDESEEVVEIVRTITQDLYQQNTASPYFTLYEKGRALNIAYFESVVARLGSHFDAYIPESEAGPVGKEIVHAHVGDVFERSGETIIFPGERYDLHTRVFVTREDVPTYEAKEIGLLHEKFTRFHPDRSLFVTDHEQGPYFQVVRKAVALINPAWEQRMTHVTHGRLTFRGMKVSSRLGNVPLAEDIIDGVIAQAQEKIMASAHSRGTADIDAIAIGALKFAILKVSLGKNMVFDVEQSLSFEGDSGPYVQYTHARCSSLMKRAAEAGITAGEGGFYDPESHAVVWELARERGVLERAVREVAPHIVAQYLLDLCHTFNAYYNDHKIIDPDNQDRSLYRVTLTAAVAATLRHGLDALGIVAPEEM